MKPWSAIEKYSPVGEIIRWSNRLMSNHAAACLIFLVSSSSMREGTKLPEGWLWHRMIPEEAVLRAVVTINRGSATVPVMPPRDARYTLVTEFFLSK